MKTWITSDSHFQHSNIIKYCSRPFKDVNEMDETLVSNWNSIVDKNDTVLHLGDFAFVKTREEIRKIVDKLNGHIHLLLGNHDDWKLVKDNGFASTRDGIWEYKYGKEKIVLCHYPMMSWNGAFHNRLHFFGHVHSTPSNIFPCQKNSYDVGVDLNDFRPRLLEEIIDKCRTKTN